MFFLKSHFLNRFDDVIKYCLRLDIVHAHESKRRYAIKLSVKCKSTGTRHSPLTFIRDMRKINKMYIVLKLCINVPIIVDIIKEQVLIGHINIY